MSRSKASVCTPRWATRWAASRNWVLATGAGRASWMSRCHCSPATTPARGSARRAVLPVAATLEANAELQEDAGLRTRVDGVGRDRHQAQVARQQYRNEIARMRKEGIVDLAVSPTRTPWLSPTLPSGAATRETSAGWARSPWSRTLSARRTTCSTVSSPCRSWRCGPSPGPGAFFWKSSSAEPSTTSPPSPATQSAC